MTFLQLSREGELARTIQLATSGPWGRRVNVVADTRLTKPIGIHGVAGLRVSGESMGFPTLVWEGDAPNDAIFTLANTRDTLFEHMRILIKGRVGAVFRYLREDASPGAVTPTNNQRSHVMIEVQAGGYCRRAVEYLEVAPGNNDVGVDSSVHVSNVGGPPPQSGYTDSAEGGEAWYFEGQQCKGHRMRDCRVNGNHITERAVRTERGASFVWSGGGSAGLTDVVFAVHEPTDPIRISDHDGDPSRKFLRVRAKDGRTGDTTIVSVNGGRFMCEEHITDAAGQVVDLHAAGPFVFRDWQLGSGRQPVGWMLLDAGNVARLTLDNVQLDAWGSSDLDPVKVMGLGRVTMRDVTTRDASGVVVYRSTR
jgi:hypothetical protein